MFICPLANLIKEKAELFDFVSNVALGLSKTYCIQTSKVKKNYFP